METARGGQESVEEFFIEYAWKDEKIGFGLPPFKDERPD